MAQAQVPLNQTILLEKTGREFGPDIALNIITEQVATSATKLLRTGGTYPIKDDSSITEVLNVIAVLCNDNRGTIDADSINKTMSIAGNGTYGRHNTTTGVYADIGLDGSDQADIATAASLYTGATAAALFNLNTLSIVGGNPPPNTFICQGLIRRTIDTARQANALHTPANPHPIAQQTEVVPLMSNAIFQAIHILERTREILGPKGWTDLFKKIKGGSSKQYNKQRTHRHRRKYSSTKRDD